MPVLDASVLISFLSDTECHHKNAVKIYRSIPAAQPFLVPEIFPVEVVAAFSRRHASDAYIRSLQGLVLSPKFVRVDLNDELLEKAFLVAKTLKLRANDALYVATAILHKQKILSLDKEIIQKCKSEYPELIE